MNKLLLSLIAVGLVSGCSTYGEAGRRIYDRNFEEPVVEQNPYLKKQNERLAPPQGGPIAVAVYGFRDLTGQRKSQPLIASLSSAVTQGADAYLIKALQDVGEARWFTVVERVGLDNLIKERQMIRQMREAYQGRDARPLPPMVFAGIIVEGGIIGYDSNTLTGGTGLRLFGIGASTQYQADTVTVNLRTVSVSTGEVLTSVTVTKTVLSYMDKFGVLQFVENGEKVVEGEIGGSVNESINRATSMAVQAAVVDTIREGARKGHWSFKEEVKYVERISTTIPAKEEPTKKEVAPEPANTTAPAKEATKGTEPKAEIVATANPKEIAKNPINPVAVVRGPPPQTGGSKLLVGTYLYKEANDKSTKSWWFAQGTTVTVIPAEGDWVEVITSDGKKGFVKQTQVGPMGK